MDEEVAAIQAQVEALAMWRFRTAMDCAADANRTLTNRAALLMNGIEAWLMLVEYRHAYRAGA